MFCSGLRVSDVVAVPSDVTDSTVLHGCKRLSVRLRPFLNHPGIDKAGESLVSGFVRMLDQHGLLFVVEKLLRRFLTADLFAGTAFHKPMNPEHAVREKQVASLNTWSEWVTPLAAR